MLFTSFKTIGQGRHQITLHISLGPTFIVPMVTLAPSIAHLWYTSFTKIIKSSEEAVTSHLLILVTTVNNVISKLVTGQVLVFENVHTLGKNSSYTTVGRHYLWKCGKCYK